MLNKKIYILGGGGEVTAIIETAQACGLEVSGIFDDNPALAGTQTAGVPVLHGLSRTAEYRDAVFAWGIASAVNRALRLKLAMELNLKPERFITLIHPKAAVSPSAQLAPGCVVHAGTVISCNVRVDAHNYISPNCVIGHDCKIGPGNTFAAGVLLTGHLAIGSANYFGLGVKVREKLVVGNCNLLGMGTVIVKNCGSGETWIGVPGRIIKQEAMPEKFEEYCNFSGSLK